MEDDLYNVKNRMIGLNYLWLVDITAMSGMTLTKYTIYSTYQHTLPLGKVAKWIVHVQLATPCVIYCIITSSPCVCVITNGHTQSTVEVGCATTMHTFVHVPA